MRLSHDHLHFSYRHSLHSTLKSITSEMKGHKISPMLSEPIQWISFATHLSWPSVLLTQTLTVLSLQDNDIGDQGAQYFADALLSNKVNTVHYSSLSWSCALFHTGTHQTSPWIPGNPRWRGTNSFRCSQTQHGEYHSLLICLLTICTFYTDTQWIRYQPTHNWSDRGLLRGIELEFWYPRSSNHHSNISKVLIITARDVTSII